METEISKLGHISLHFTDSTPHGRAQLRGVDLGLLNAWEKRYFPPLFCVFLVHLLKGLLVSYGHGIEKGWQSLLI